MHISTLTPPAFDRKVPTSIALLRSLFQVLAFLDWEEVDFHRRVKRETGANPVLPPQR